MKRKFLLLFVMAPLFSAVCAQKNPKTIIYAITGVQKGNSSWTEVRLVDFNTGEEVKSIYQSKNQVEVLNARTGKPIRKKDLTSGGKESELRTAQREYLVESRVAPSAVVVDGKVVRPSSPTGVRVAAPVIVDGQTLSPSVKAGTEKKNVTVVIENRNVNVNENRNVNVISNTNVNQSKSVQKRIVYVSSTRIQSDKPFATNSAACAYDKKHERLYYTPMGINQLRYIDLKTNKIYYFEDEAFGTVKGSHDVQNQITRMVIASDGDGYALTNDGNHLIKFTTGKKPQITDLGEVKDASDGAQSIHSSNGYGGDMIADKQKNLYLITANRAVFKISIDNRTASYLGAIKGLPKGFSTNGAAVEEGTKVIVSSSSNTAGYYRFDLTTLQAEKVSTGASVFNASDLANGVLAFEKKKKEKKQRDAVPPPPLVEQVDVVTNENKAKQQTLLQESVKKGAINVYPNPVTNRYVKLSFENQPAGRYEIQLMDALGKVIKVQRVTINNKVQIEEFRLPAVAANGNYLVKVVSSDNKVSIVNKIVVQK
ncbi:MAG: T9SS type A sorting domain-containing protein [Flavisolibacter sp.]